jgi:DNA-binding NtrC family response regulator
VRELESVIERALLLGEDEEVQPRDLPAAVRAGRTGRKGAPGLELPDSGIDLDEVERALIRQALAKVSGNVTRAARLLGLTRRTLQYRLEKMNEPETAEQPSMLGGERT